MGRRGRGPRSCTMRATPTVGQSEVPTIGAAAASRTRRAAIEVGDADRSALQLRTRWHPQPPIKDQGSRTKDQGRELCCAVEAAVKAARRSKQRAIEDAGRSKQGRSKQQGDRSRMAVEDAGRSKR